MIEFNWDEWLRERHFKYEDIERSGRHWLLWIGGAIPDVTGHLLKCNDDFGIEIAPAFHLDRPDHRSLFLRADYAGRYSRFLHCRRVCHGDDVIRIIEAIIHPRTFGECWTPYGFLTTPESAKRMKAEMADRFDLRIAEHYAKATGENLEKAAKR